MPNGKNPILYGFEPTKMKWAANQADESKNPSAFFTALRSLSFEKRMVLFCILLRKKSKLKMQICAHGSYVSFHAMTIRRFELGAIYLRKGKE